MEAEYSFNKRKPTIFVRLQENYDADGWLLFLLGKNIYFDISSSRFDQNIEKLIKEIRRQVKCMERKCLPDGGSLNINHPEKVNGKGISATEVAFSKATQQSQGSAAAAEWQKWTEAKVQEWLEEGGLDSLKNEYSSPFCIRKTLHTLL